MRLEPHEFREHMDKMLASGQKKQARIWAESGTLIYVNCEDLHELYEDEYQDLIEGS